MSSSFVLPSLLIGFFALFYGATNKFDIGRIVYNHRPGPCRTVEGPVHGSEDIELIPSKAIAFISSGLLYAPIAANTQGKIFLFNFTESSRTSDYAAEELVIVGEGFDKDTFHPHGLSHWALDNGTIRLYVVSHASLYEHSVEVFDFDETHRRLLYAKSIRSDDVMIVSSSGASQNPIMGFAEHLSGWRAGSVYSIPGGEFFTELLIVSGRGTPNGVTYDSRNKKLFVAVYSEEAVEVYDVAEDHQSLIHITTVALGTGPDNLFVDDSGVVYAGCLPVMHTVMTTMSDCGNAAKIAPSQVLRIEFSPDYKGYEITEVYSNDGREISASTVAVRHGKQLLIGSVCRRPLLCTVTDVSML